MWEKDNLQCVFIGSAGIWCAEKTWSPLNKWCVLDVLSLFASLLHHAKLSAHTDVRSVSMWVDEKLLVFVLASLTALYPKQVNCFDIYQDNRGLLFWILISGSSSSHLHKQTLRTYLFLVHFHSSHSMFVKPAVYICNMHNSNLVCPFFNAFGCVLARLCLSACMHP